MTFSEDLDALLGAGAEVMGRGSQAIVMRGGPIAPGKVVKLFHEPKDAQGELDALKHFGAVGIGSGPGTAMGSRGVIEDDLGRPNPFIHGEPGGSLIFVGYVFDPAIIEPGFAGLLRERLVRLHAQGITHNDISPKNIVFRECAAGRLMPGLIDLGWAHLPDYPHNARMRELDSKIGLDGSPGAYDRFSCRVLEAFFDLLVARAFEPGCSMRPFLADRLSIALERLPFAF